MVLPWGITQVKVPAPSLSSLLTCSLPLPRRGLWASPPLGIVKLSNHKGRGQAGEWGSCTHEG